ncbi:MAG: hypothetical protein R3Y58_10990 [Eubacteriales bacterium]
MKDKLKKITCFLITIALICAAVRYLNVVIRPTGTDISVQAIRTFHEDMPDDTFEVIGYGSSHMWKSMDPITLYTDYGIGAYNYGCNWQRINTTSLFIEDSLRTQSPDIIIIETFLVGEVLQNVDIESEIYYAREIPDFDAKTDYLEQCFVGDFDRYLSYYLPICAFHENWVNLTKDSFLGVPDNMDFDQSFGYWPMTTVTPTVIGDYSTFEQLELEAASLSVLDGIVEICKENDIEIIFFTAPYEGVYSYSNAMNEYATSHGYVYLDLFQNLEETGINGETDFQDIGHLNYSGAVKVADYLGEYIVNNYDVTDMRTIEGNIWSQSPLVQ